MATKIRKKITILSNPFISGKLSKATAFMVMPITMISLKAFMNCKSNKCKSN